MNWMVKALCLPAMAFMLASPTMAAAAKNGAGGLVEDPAASNRDWCEERKLGNWFYCTRPKAEEQKPEAPAPAPTKSAVEELDAVTAELRELKAKAILDPTPDNISAYVKFQRVQLDRSSYFADQWQRLLWQDPELDYTLERPVGNLGKRLFTDARKVSRDQALSRLSERYGLFYFFSSDCGACTIFAPILKSVADSNHISVMAVSTDGGPSEHFPRYVVDSGQRERMGIPTKAVPAVVLFDTVTKKTLPVGFGVLSADEIMERIFVLTQKEVGDDY